MWPFTNTTKIKKKPALKERDNQAATQKIILPKPNPPPAKTIPQNKTRNKKIMQPTPPNQPPQKYVFTLEVFEQNEKGQFQSHIDEGVIGTSELELAKIYALSEQKIRVVSKVPYVNLQKSEGDPVGAGLSVNDIIGGPGDFSALPNNSPLRGPPPQDGPGGSLSMTPPPSPPSPLPSPTPEPRVTNPRPPFQPIQKKQPEPKYLLVGNTKIKIIGDEVYQQHWIRATVEEAENIRVISTKNNRIVSMKDRHFEIQKWVKVEPGIPSSMTDDAFDSNPVSSEEFNRDFSWPSRSIRPVTDPILQEGRENKGGVNEKPTIPLPTIPPKGQNPKPTKQPRVKAAKPSPPPPRLIKESKDKPESISVEEEEEEKENSQ
jgi:hypothetical protein